MIYVAQKEPFGCVIACVAMVTGHSYDEIRALIPYAIERGLHQGVQDELLGDLGYAVVRRYRHNARLKEDRTTWPLPPFAPAHIVHVHVPGGAHAIVLDDRGVVLDPFDTKRDSLQDSGYTAINSIDGVFPVGTMGGAE